MAFQSRNFSHSVPLTPITNKSLDNRQNSTIVNELPGWYWPIMWTIAGITAVDNLIVILLIVSRKRLYTKSNTFILALSFADLIIGAIVAPTEYTVVHILPQDQTSDIISIVCEMFFDISAVNLCLVTFDRYLAVVCPLKYLTFVTDRRVCAFICSAWLIPALFAVIRIFVFMNVDTQIIEDISSSVLVVLFQILPIIYLTISFIHITCIVRKHQRTIHKENEHIRFNHQGGPLRQATRHRSILPLIGTINGTFVLCYSVNVYDFFTRRLSLHIPYTYIKVNTILINLNSLVNPIIYGLLKRDFKQEIKRLVCSKCTKLRVGKSAVSVELTNVNSFRK